VYDVTAVTAQKVLAGGQIVLNDRAPMIANPNGVMYVRTQDLDTQGKLKPGVPFEPLILRANAGDCIEVNLTNALEPSAQVFQQKFLMAPPFNTTVNNQPVFKSKMSGVVGLHPQLLSYDAALGGGINVGWNRVGQTDQVAGFGKTVKYLWYAGKIDRDSGGQLVYTPVEFGSINLFPSDPLYQHINGLFGGRSGTLLGTTFEGAARFNMLPHFAWNPYVFGGVGWQHYDVTRTNVTLSDSGMNDKDTLLEFPLGVGVAYRTGGFVIDVRGTFRIATDQDLVLKNPAFPSTIAPTTTDFAAMDTWEASAAVGYEF
jgi:hypothetical protein